MKLWPENAGQPKSAKAFLLSRPMENEKFSFSIGLDNKKLKHFLVVQYFLYVCMNFISPIPEYIIISFTKNV